ncbi:Rap1-interacting factor 1 N terminal-domain-containing protein [Peziza echinospora]|nr:Rap1-interacting factor 1 N terminal-domain-containing protein [Peziza echinospora]
MVHSVTSGSSGSSSESAEHILFDTAKLATRPPTPPRESSRPPDSPLKDPSDAHRDAVHSTPNSSNTSTDRPKKRVEFSPWTDYHRPDDPSPQRAAKPDLTPKSILKPFNPSVISITANNIPFYSHDSFPAMLESITQALASTERSKKLDTYVTFTNCLKAYDDQPDVRALKNKMPLLCSFIRRDLFAKAPNSVNNSNDSQLIQQAVKLLAILAWLPTLAESIPEDDAVFFIQHATQLIQNPQSPKILVSPFLHFLSTQVFPPRFMTAERVGSIITALQNLEDRIGGNTVIQARLQIYKKLMHQNKQVMASRTIDWMEHLLAATLSNHKETRTVAMVCMSEAAKLLGSEKSVTRGVGNLLNRESGDGVRLFEKVRERLEEFLKNGDGSHVAQIWGVMILLLRGRPPITNWEYFNPWLQVIQDCFNSPNVTTKVAANTAWRRIIYVLNCGTELNTKNMELLTRPISRYLSPQSSSSSPKGPRQAALSNICALLYYNFRPNAPAKHISLTWDLVVVALIEKLVLHSQNEVDDGCKILTALFDGTHQKAWNEVRGLEASAIKPEEIFRLDPKWVKFNSAIVLKTIEVALRRSTWEGEDPVICVLWRKFTKTLADANMKEIKISAETMETVAHIFNLFQRLWHDGPSLYVNAENKSSAQFMHRFAFLITTTFDAIGTICFTEKQLSFDEHNEFVAASTPSNRFSSSNSFSAAFHSPVVHLFQLFLQPFQGAEVSKEYFESIRTIISKCLEAQDSRRKGLSLLAACSSVLPQRGASTVDLEAWNIVADLAGKALSKPQEKAHISPTPVTWEFKDVVKILQWGCRYNVPAWASLFHIFVTTVQEEQGDAQMISTVIEPLAEILRLEKLDSDSPVWLIHGKTLLEKAQYPKLKASEIVARIPFGGSNRKATNTESYDNLYDMVDQFLSTAYTVCEDQKSIQTVANFIVAVTEFVYRAPPTSLLLLLRRIQNGMAVWLADSKNLLIKKESGLTMTVQGLWNAVTNAITRLPRHDSLALQSMTVLVASGLESSRKAIVNSSIKTWNSSFGKQASLEYPSRVRLAMKKLRPIADIALPAFPEDIDEIVPTPPIWTESQESEDFVPDQNLWSSPTPIPSARRRDRTSSPTKEPVPLSNRSFLARLRDASSKPSPKARPKHLDSQVIFAPIERGSGNTSEEVDSQVLTEHQKEVRDRQHEEPSVYLPGLSTERPKKVVRPFVKSASIPPIVLNKQLSERQQRSPSVDEFVDAPEVVTKDIPESAKSQDTPSYLQEVDVVPSTVFTVQVPSRTSLQWTKMLNYQGISRQLSVPQEFWHSKRVYRHLEIQVDGY